MNFQVNEYGFPTLEGLLSIYTEGVTDKDYYIATAQSVHMCLQNTQKRHLVNPQSLEGEYIFYYLNAYGIP